MFYACYDTTVSRSNPGHGFANAKQFAAFSTQEKLEAFLDAKKPFDFTARRVSRVEALKNLDSDENNNRGLFIDPVSSVWEDNLSFIVLVPARY
jgi:hypothetical protein